VPALADEHEQRPRPRLSSVSPTLRCDRESRDES
jgi:hypothetical protein